MKLIYDILKKLKKQELRQVRQQIERSVFEYEKVGKLFDLVTRYPEQEESFYSQKIYGKDPDNTFRVTKSRLKRMLENVLIQDKSLTGYASSAINAKHQARKKLLQGEILLGRGAYLASKNILQQVISSAKKYDLHEELFEAELLLFRNKSTKSSVLEFERQAQSLLALNEKSAMVNEALILHYAISNLIFNRTLKQDELEDVRKRIDRMLSIAEQTQHPRAENAYYLSEVYYYQIQGDLNLALHFCKKYRDLIEKTPSQYTKARLGGAYLQLAQVALQVGKLEEADDYSEQVLTIFSKEEMNYLLAMELSFRIAFYRKNPKRAFQVIDDAFNHPEFETSRMLAARWHYFRACQLFQAGAFREAYLELNDTTPLLGDKYGMNLHIRLLEIMIMHEMEKLDLMETKILNMRQFIKRTQRNSAMKRPVALVKILMNWYKNHYDFTSTVEQVVPQLQKLDAIEADQPLRNTDFELIRFERWIQEKGKKSRK
ncbi:MAG: hypothetical protein AAGI38_03935 [Bacteroidota bacterium]